jgi:hypothetical protein
MHLIGLIYLAVLIVKDVLQDVKIADTSMT